MKHVLLACLLIGAPAHACTLGPFELPAPEFTTHDRVFSGRVVGITSARLFRAGATLEEARERDLHTFGVLIEVESSASDSPFPGSIVEVFTYDLAGHCGPAPRDSAAVLEDYPPGMRVLVVGSEARYVAREEAAIGTDASAWVRRVDAWFVEDGFVREVPPGYDPAKTTPHDFDAALEASGEPWPTLVDDYEMWKDLQRVTLSNWQPLRRLASYPGYLRCSQCYGRLLMNYVYDAQVASDLLGHLAAMQKKHGVESTRFEIR